MEFLFTDYKGDVMSRKIYLLLALVFVIAIAGCAKRNTAFEDTQKLTRLAQVPVVGQPSELGTDATHAYVALDQGGMATINMDTYELFWYPDMLSQDDSVTDFWRTRKLSVASKYNRVFLNEIQFTDRIHIIDSSDPENLRVIYSITGGTYDIQDIAIREYDEPVEGNVIEIAFCSNINLRYALYNGDFWMGINPIYPVDAPALLGGVELDDNYIYGAAQQRGLVTFQKSTGAVIGEHAVRGEAQKLVVRNGYAYIASRQGGLQVVDIRDINNPISVAEYITTGYASDVDYSNGIVAVASGSGGAYVFDASDPSNIRLIQRITECGYVNVVKLKDDVLIIGSRDNGVYFYQMN